MLQNFDNLPARPSIEVSCGGQLAANLAPPSAAPSFTADVRGTFGVMWRPADVTVHVDQAGATTGCDVTPLLSPDGSGEYVTTDDPSY